MSERGGVRMRAVRARVRGRVQGVGFRWFVRETARRESLAGWVRNEADGSVALTARGEASAVERLIHGLHEGPPASAVESVSVEDVEVDGNLPYPFTVLK